MHPLKDKYILGIPNEKLPFIIGMALLVIEIGVITFIFLSNPSLSLKIISMITAFHLGGRLAIIGTGLELNFSTLTVIFIILTYLTAFLLIMLSVIGFLWVKAQEFKLFKNFVETRMKKAEQRAKTMKKWSWIGIVAFVWMPFPMTGAIMGFLIARAEGYNSLTSIMITIPSMWFGVVCWTLWFDELYKIIEKIGPQLTRYVTILLVLLPLLYYLSSTLIKKIKNRDTCDE
ncbi:MAG TPA: small multi-drug export protein [Acidobacteriota bacterium]|nr:small multi-drug export protein [Acidobacteriota bacterium]